MSPIIHEVMNLQKRTIFFLQKLVMIIIIPCKIWLLNMLSNKKERKFIRYRSFALKQNSEVSISTNSYHKTVHSISILFSLKHQFFSSSFTVFLFSLGNFFFSLFYHRTIFLFTFSNRIRNKLDPIITILKE